MEILEAEAPMYTDKNKRIVDSKMYGRDLDPFVLTRALATFQRSLLSGSSPWDRWQQGELAISEAVQHGAELFGSEGLACDRCHTPPLFTFLQIPF